MTPAARIAAAIDLLDAVEATARRPADATANDFFRPRRYIGSADRRAVSERAWAVIRQRLRLDWHLARVGAKPTARLLVIAHLILVEQGDPDFALPGGQHAADRMTPAEARVAAALAGQPLINPGMPEHIRLNLPEWAMASLARRFGPRLAEVAASLENAAPLDLRVNLLRTSRDTAATLMAAAGVPTEPTPFSPWGLRVPTRRQVLQTQPFIDGLIEIQDEGSQLIALLTDARPGMRVADYCAGAAGKTLALAATMQNRGKITACDVSATRLEGATRRLRRAGVDNAERHLLEPGDRWAKRRAESFDRVLVDAPCTGTGTWRRNPDARLRTQQSDLEELVKKQSVIMDTAAGLVRPGGRLIYATCSLLPDENEDQVDAFLTRREAFRRIPLAELWPTLGQPGDAPCAGPDMALDPAAHGTDGFFAAVLERR